MALRHRLAVHDTRHCSRKRSRPARGIPAPGADRVARHGAVFRDVPAPRSLALRPGPQPGERNPEHQPDPQALGPSAGPPFEVWTHIQRNLMPPPPPARRELYQPAKGREMTIRSRFHPRGLMAAGIALVVATALLLPVVVQAQAAAPAPTGDPTGAVTGTAKDVTVKDAANP